MHGSIKERKRNIVKFRKITNDIARKYEFLIQYIVKRILIGSTVGISGIQNLRYSVWKSQFRFRPDIINPIEFKENNHIWIKNMCIKIILNWFLALYILYKFCITVSESYFPPILCRSMFIVTSSQTTSFCDLRAEDNAGSSVVYKCIYYLPNKNTVSVKSTRSISKKLKLGLYEIFDYFLAEKACNSEKLSKWVFIYRTLCNHQR